MGVVLRAHPVSGKSHIQCQRRGCNNISFSQRTAPIARSFCEGCTWHDLHILVTAPFCCNWKSLVASAWSFILWQQTVTEIMRHNHSSHTLVIMFNYSQIVSQVSKNSQSFVYCLFAPHIYGCSSSCTSYSWWIAYSTQHQKRGCNSRFITILAHITWPRAQPLHGSIFLKLSMETTLESESLKTLINFLVFLIWKLLSV